MVTNKSQKSTINPSRDLQVMKLAKSTIVIFCIIIPSKNYANKNIIKKISLHYIYNAQELKLIK